MAGKGSTGLSIGYRIGYRLRVIGVTLFGPAELTASEDPRERLRRERAARVAAAAARKH